MKTVRQRIFELAEMMTDGQISQRNAEKMLPEEEEQEQGLIYDDEAIDGLATPDQNPSIF